jgi:hypothetical protein
MGYFFMKTFVSFKVLEQSSLQEEEEALQSYKPIMTKKTYTFFKTSNYFLLPLPIHQSFSHFGRMANQGNGNRPCFSCHGCCERARVGGKKTPICTKVVHLMHMF